MAHPTDEKERVQEASDIVALVGEQVALTPKGREYVGLCPFHDDGNPSMHVSPVKQIYKCFACGAGGDVFSWMMNYHKLSFPEALGELAERAGIELAGFARGTEAGGGTRQRLAGANERAMGFYRERYAEQALGREARDYVASRGIGAEMVEAFQIGYAPAAWDALARHAGSKRWAVEDFEQAGLLTPRGQGGGYYDRFRHRLIFPILDPRGRPIAFGGRRLAEGEEPKYLNSPETELFHKSRTLYGIHRAKKPIIDTRTAVIVEGYTDVIACHQAGAANVVATLGTALTREHARELKRFAERVVLVFDADAAGEKASERAVELFFSEALDVGIATLPPGRDPADLVAEGGREAWESVVAASVEALDHLVGLTETRLASIEGLTGRQREIESLLERLEALGLAEAGGLRQGMILRRLSEMTGLPVARLEKLLAPARRRAGKRAGRGGVADEVAEAPRERPVEKAIRIAERHLVGAIVRRPALLGHTLADGRPLEEALAPGDLSGGPARRIFERILDRHLDARPVSLQALLAAMAEAGEEEMARFLTDCDEEVAWACGEDETELEVLLASAADRILASRRTREYRQDRTRLVAAAGPDVGALTRRMTEHLRENPSPTRIARVRR